MRSCHDLSKDSLALELAGERRGVDTYPREFGEHFFGVASVNRQYAL